MTVRSAFLAWIRNELPAARAGGQREAGCFMGKRGSSEQERTLRGAQTLALAVILLAVAMCSDCSQRSRVSALDGFWMPFERRSAVLISVPGLDTQVLPGGREMPGKVMSTTDVQAAVAISSFLASKGTPARLCRRGDRTFQGARNSPVVVIGALTEGFPEHPGLHFTFPGEADGLSIRMHSGTNWSALGRTLGHALRRRSRSGRRPVR